MNASYMEAIFKIAQSAPDLRDKIIAQAANDFGYDQSRIQCDVDDLLRTQEKIRERDEGNGAYGGTSDPNNPLYDPDHRSDLTIAAWRKRKLPPRDYLLGELLCTTSRWLVIGETGVGKTLLLLDLAAAIASGTGFLGFEAPRKARVMYLDGELPQETFQERLEIVAARYGEDMELFGYSREYLTTNNPEEMPAFNTPQGQEWLLREIDKIKPDLIVFDAIMSLMIGNMSEEESWSPVKELIREISRRHVAQIWLHHTGHDASRGYGTKTREWEMDTVAIMTKVETDADPSQVLAAFQLEFTKARLRTPKNYQQYANKVIHDTPNGFTYRDSILKGHAEKKGKDGDNLKTQLMLAYERLAKAVEATREKDGMVKKVSVKTLGEELRNTGYLETNDRGQIAPTSRTQFHRAKTELLKTGKLIEADGLIWEPLVVF